MPVHLSIGTALDKSKLASDVVYLALLEIDVLNDTTGAVIETLRFAQNNENYVLEGNTYIPMPFEFETISSKNELPTLSLTIQDYALIIQAYLQEYKGGIDWPIRLIITNTASATVDIRESFTIMTANCSADDYSISFTMGSENPLAQRFPPRIMYKNRCSWLYKSPQCGYTGPLPTCSFTKDGVNGCAAHNNTRRFGGFSGIRNYD